MSTRENQCSRADSKAPPLIAADDDGDDGDDVIAKLRAGALDVTDVRSARISSPQQVRYRRPNGERTGC
jgi:membrane-bound lytic murein transglycosylase MltF